MNTLGVALDLSHANTQTTAAGIAASSRPPMLEDYVRHVAHALDVCGEEVEKVLGLNFRRVFQEIRS